MAPQPTTAQLKHDIDRGRGGDKVDVIDPATAPLGTDDEAAGTPPGPEARKLAYDEEIGSSPVTSERTDSDHAVTIYVALVLALVATVSFAIWLA